MATTRNPIAQRNAGYALHVFTASGAVFGMLALQAIIDGRVRDSLIWLIVCQILDAIDGPIARKLDVVIHAPWLSGVVLDEIVDYFTYVIIPVMFLLNTNMMPERYETFVAGTILLTCAIWWARTDHKTNDSWFVGFPCMWNLVVISFLLLKTPPTWVVVISLILCALQLTNIKFPHPVRVMVLRPVSITISVLYVGAITVLSLNYTEPLDSPSLLTKILILSLPIYTSILAIWKTWFAPKKPVKSRKKVKVRK
jgi:phosphatidylcholine synthase